MLEYHLKPGEKEPMHSHPRGFVYYLADAKVRVSFPDGKSEESELKAGEAHWRDALSHAVENIGKTEAHAVALELKMAAQASQVRNSKEAAEFDHVALHVRYLNRSSEFYHGVLGLEKVSDPFNDGRHQFFRLSPHSELHLIAGGEADMEHDIDVHFALKVGSLPAFLKSFQEKQVRYFSSKREERVVTHRPDGVNQVYFQDPDGYWVELNDSRL